MKTRDVVIFTGKKFKVPQCIQRIDHRYTHGWQVRYGGTKMFSDGSNDGSGAKAALEAATRELIHRITTMPTPSRLQPKASHNKSTSLPVGISGPLRRRRRGTSDYASLQVLLPRYGEKPRNVNIYIGSASTYTKERFNEALKKAVAMRSEAEQAYRDAEVRARRASARLLKQQLSGAKAPAKTPAKAPVKTLAKASAKAPAKSPAKAAGKAAAKPAPARKAAARKTA